MSRYPETEVLHYSCYAAPKPWFGAQQIVCFRREDLKNQVWFDLIGPALNAKALPLINVAYQGTKVDRAVVEDKMEIDVLKKHFGSHNVDIRVADVNYDGPKAYSYTITKAPTTVENTEAK